MNSSVVQAMELMAVPDADALAVTAACEVVIGWAHARQIEAIEQVSREMPDFIDQTGELIDPAPAAEVAAALHWSSGAAIDRADLAHWLCTDLPHVLDGLRLGRLDLPKAREIVIGTTELPTAARQQLATDAVDYATGHTARSCGPGWPARSQRSTPTRPRAAANAPYAPAGSGSPWSPTAWPPSGAYLSAEEAQACWNAPQRRGANIEGGVDAARAGPWSPCSPGSAPATRSRQVIITPGRPRTPRPRPAERRTHPAPQPRRRPDHLDRPRPSTGYTPAPSLARWVSHPRPALPLPRLPTPAVMCDLDHVILHPGGSTTTATSPPCADTHHRLKPTQLESPNAARRGPALDQPRGHVYHTSLDDP